MAHGAQKHPLGLFAIALAFLSLSPSVLAADPSTPILLVPNRTSPAVSQQLSIELAAMGYATERRANCDRELFEKEIQEGSVAAAICVLTLDKEGQESVLVMLPNTQSLTSTRPPNVEPRLFAVRLAEQARAAVVLQTEAVVPSPQIEDSPDPKSPDPELKTPPSPKKPEPSYAELGVSGAFEAAPGGMGAATRIGLRASVWPSDTIGFTGLALAPVHPQRVIGNEGEAEIWATSFVAGPSLRLSSGRVQLDGSALVGGGLISMQGKAEAPREAKSDMTTPLLLGGGLGVSSHINAPVFARLGAVVLFNVPSTTVNFGERVAATRDVQLALTLEVGLDLY